MKKYCNSRTLDLVVDLHLLVYLRSAIEQMIESTVMRDSR